MMRHVDKVLFLSAALALASCGSRDIIKDVPTRLVKAGETISLEKDSSFKGNFPEVLNCVDLRVAGDSTLVLQDQVTDDNPYHFKAYSTNSSKYLGEFAREGNGPGELVSPVMVKTNAGTDRLAIKMNGTGKSCFLDVRESIISKNAVSARSLDLPANTVDWLPLADSSMFILAEGKGEMTYQRVDNGTVSRSLNLYEGFGWQCATQLSAVLVGDGAKGKMAEVMVLLPQINIIDTKSGEIRPIAVDKAYKNWESIIHERLSLDSVEYYTSATSSDKYIFAVYKALPAGERSDLHNLSIHVFDWDGNFLYDCRVKENIGNITFDGAGNYLYCVEKPEGRVVRYDFGFLR